MLPLPDQKRNAQWFFPDAIILLAVLIPLVGIAWYTSFTTFHDLTNFTLSRRQAIASLAATTVKENLDKVVDVGTSLSTRVQFQKLVESEKWDDAVKIMERVPKDFPYIERVALFDPRGILTTATPLTPEISAVIGKDFSYRDYYQGVSKNWEPYVAEAIKPAVPLGYNLVPVTIPIKSESQKILGILLLNVKLDTIAVWSKNIEVGPAGFAYIVDHKGHLIAHPTLLPAEDIVDFSVVPTVQKILKGERGVEVTVNPIENEERVTAYEPVAQYGWGVAVVQPTRTAFMERNTQVFRLVIMWLFVLVATAVFMYLLLRDRALIRSQEEKQETFLHSIGDGVFAIDRNFAITLWNRVASELTGWSRDEALGKPMRDIVKFIRESDRKENIVFIEEAMLRGEVRQMEPDTLLSGKDGREIQVGDSAAPIFDKKGAVAGAIVVFRDIGKEREAQRLRSDFTYASHQLRTPVTKALWSIEALLKERDPTQVAEGLRTAYRALQSVHKLSEELVEVSALDSGEIIPEREAVKLAELITKVTEVIQKGGWGAGTTIDASSIDPSFTPKADKRLLRQTVSVLLENAVIYNSQEGTIVVRATPQENGILIEIKDSGIGIPEDQQALVFTKFFRGNNFDTTRIAGAGLGLYLAREYVKLLGGKIWFRSERGRGTTFSVFLPQQS